MIATSIKVFDIFFRHQLLQTSMPCTSINRRFQSVNRSAISHGTRIKWNIIFDLHFGFRSWKRSRSRELCNVMFCRQHIAHQRPPLPYHRRISHQQMQSTMPWQPQRLAKRRSPMPTSLLISSRSWDWLQSAFYYSSLSSRCCSDTARDDPRPEIGIKIKTLGLSPWLAQLLFVLITATADRQRRRRNVNMTAAWSLTRLNVIATITRLVCVIWSYFM